MANTIQPQQSVRASSQAFLERTQQLNAGNKAESTGARAALGQSTIRVGSGQNRQKAHSAGGTIRGMLTSLSNSLKTVLYSPVALVKALHAYPMRPRRAETDLAPKKAMAQVSRSLDSGAAGVYSFLNSNPVTKSLFRDQRDAASPPSSSLDALEREAGDAVTDLKSAAKDMLNDVNRFFKDR